MPDLSSFPSPLVTYRKQFSALQNKLYFNYGGQGPLSQVALDAILDGYKVMQQDGPFTKKVQGWIDEGIAQTHQAIADELTVTPDTITLTDSVSTGCNIALWGLPWKQGDRILITDCEHPGIIAAVQELSRRFGVAVDRCAVQATLNEGDPVAAIAEQVHPKTRLIVLSHILWNTGQVLPLGHIVTACRRQNPKVLLLVDAAQSVGVLPLNLTEIDIDFYAFTGHKWLCGPDGVGGLYIRPPLREMLQPTFIGWRGIRTDTTGHPIGWKPDGAKFEVATSAVPLLRGLNTAIHLHQTWGNSTQRYQRICQLSERLWSNLKKISGVNCLRTKPPESGLVSFTVEAWNHSALVQALEAQQIMARLIVNPNCVRVCVHFLTLESEVDEFALQLQTLLETTQ